jgi:L-ascorbate metabolism protein UlaG (beta-lactamase superfamily)
MTACGTSPRASRSALCFCIWAVRFPVTGPVRYTMTAQDAVELCGLIKPRTAIPIHYEGWKHFRHGRDAIERVIAGAPEDIRECIRWLPIRVAVDVSA